MRYNERDVQLYRVTSAAIQNLPIQKEIKKYIGQSAWLMFLKGENKYFYDNLKKESLPPSLLYDNLFTLAAR